MIIPPDQPHDRTITISQTSHSWVSGQLARVWGNELFGAFGPLEPICYAAEQHDIGFLDWENQPTLNVDTGLPYTFDELAESVHLGIWRTGIYRLRPICSYASLIVSLHFCGLCERFHRRQNDSDCSEVSRFLGEQREYQKRARETLSLDSLFAPAIAPDNLAYHRDLMAAWDLFSLELCRGRSREFKLPEVLLLNGERVDLRLRQRSTAEPLWEVDPWPFAVKSLTTFCEGRVLRQRFTDQEEMREALRNAHRTTIRFRLVPAA
ncbi:MAG: DUF3891 family protein [Verrucomicrobia bacterium]|nr:DUF3891 family protein [Verrucomicrobiota bacterium]